MRWTSLDQITRSLLLQRGYPIHWYVDFMKYASDGLRELTFDVLRVVNSAKLPVNSYKAVTLPCDYVDWVKVGIQTGQYVHPLAQGPINRLNNFDSSGRKIPYDDTMPDGTFADIRGMTEYVNGLTALGEHTGGIFNHNAGRSIGTFIELPEREEIQLDNDFPYDFIILDYVSDGGSCTCGCDCGTDSATRIIPYAIAAIEAYVNWKLKAYNRAYGAGEVEQARLEFATQVTILRARKGSMSRWDIVQAARLGYSGTYKN